MFDDFGSGDDASDFRVEQQATDRHLKELNSSGFRDGQHNFMENEAIMQTGFDQAYKLFYRLAFLAGKTRALSLHSVIPLRNDSAFLAKIAHKLECVESYDYAKLIQWKLFITYNSNEAQHVEARLDEVDKLVALVETELNALNQAIMAFNTSHNTNDLHAINSILDNFSTLSGQTNSGEHENAELNAIIQKLNI